MLVEGFQLIPAVPLLDRSKTVMFSKTDDGAWVILGMTLAANQAIINAGLINVPLDMKLRDVVMLAHQVTGSSLRLKRGINSLYIMPEEGMMLQCEDTGSWKLSWSPLGNMYHRQDVSVPLRYIALLQALDAGPHQTRRGLLIALRTAMEHLAAQDDYLQVTVDGYTLRRVETWTAMYGPSLTLPPVDIWHADAGWAITVDDETALYDAFDEAGLIGMFYSETLAAFVDRVRSAANVNELEFITQYQLQQRYTIESCGMSLVKHVDAAGWSLIPHGEEWLDDVDECYAVAYYQLADTVFSDIDNALACLDAVLAGEYRPSIVIPSR